MCIRLLADFENADAWIDAFFAGQSARGPQHGAKPAVNYASLGVLWLSAVPYGLWSDQVRRPSMEEHGQWVKQLEVLFEQVLDYYRLSVRTGMTVNDLACAVASLIEGVWLNQCLTIHHPCDPTEPISTALRRSGRLLWLGATEPRAGRRSAAASASCASQAADAGSAKLTSKELTRCVRP